MKRVLPVFLPVILALSLVLGAGIRGMVRAEHAFAQFGAQTLVICGEAGVEEITLDRNGNEVDPAGMACGHCSDCLLGGHFALSAETNLPAQTHYQRQRFELSDLAAPRSPRLFAEPRGPPNRAGEFV